MMGQQAEGIGIAFEVHQILPLLGCESVLSLLAHVILQESSLSLTEVSTYGTLATMSEGRVAHVVCQTGSTHYGTQFGEMSGCQMGMTLQQESAHVVAQTAAHAAYLQTVCESVMHKDASWQGEHLRLVLQTSEGSREDQAVIIALKFRAVVLAVWLSLLSQTFIGE